MTIENYRLPIGIEQGSQFGPTFKTVIQEAISGNEQRVGLWTKCRGVGNLTYGLRSSDDPLGDYVAIRALFRAHFGSLIPFRFKDWGDFTASEELFGTGDATTTAFQLVKTYDPSFILTGVPGVLVYVRSIMLPISPVIEVNGVTKTLGADYSLSSSGVVTFVSAPAHSAQLTWSGEFDVPVRFDTDQLPVVLNAADLASIRAIPIKEVIGES